MVSYLPGKDFKERLDTRENLDPETAPDLMVKKAQKDPLPVPEENGKNHLHLSKVAISSILQKKRVHQKFLKLQKENQSQKVRLY